MQHDAPNPYTAFQGPSEDQRQKYPVFPSVSNQQIPYPSYYMPIQPNGQMMYPVYLPQMPGGQIPQGQPLPDIQNVPQVPMYYMSAPLVQEPVDNSPSLIEIIRNSTPEFFYKSLLRFSIAMAFTIFLCMIWLSANDYIRPWGTKMMAFNLVFNVIVALTGLRALKSKQNKRFKRHMKIAFAFYVISIYKLVTNVFMWGLGCCTLLNLYFFLQSGYICCKGKKLYKLVKKEWKQKNSNQQQANVEPQQSS